ncbi:hypothetical protein QQX85_10545, partial [Klebsiella variicola]
GTVCVVGKMRDLILQLSKSSIYSTKPLFIRAHNNAPCISSVVIGSSGDIYRRLIFVACHFIDAEGNYDWTI